MNARHFYSMLWALLFLSLIMGAAACVTWILPPLLSQESARTVVFSIAGIVLFVVGLLTALYGLLRSEVLNPLRRVGQQIAQIERPHDPATRLALTGHDEVDYLVEAIDGLLKRLHQSEYQYQVFADASPDIVFLTDREGRILLVNKSGADMFLSTPEALAGRQQEDLFPPHLVEFHKQSIQKLLETGQPVIMEDCERLIGHTHIWMHRRLFPVKNQQGKITAILNIAQDITARKAAEEALRTSERHLAITLQSIGDAVITTDTQGNIVRMNPVAERLTGWALAEAEGRPLAEVFQIINQHMRQRVANPVEVVLKTGEVQGLADDTVLISRQGEERVIADSAAAIVDNESQQTYGVVMVFRDVTPAYTLQQMLKVKDKAIETALNAISFMDQDQRISYANAAFLKTWGYADPKEVLGRQIGDFFDNPSAWSEAMATSLQAGQWIGDLAARKKSGALFPIRLSASMAKSDGGQPLCLMAVIEDITERKRAEEEIRRLHASLEQRVQERTAELEAFAYSISHDLRAPLRAIDSFARIISESHSSHVGREGQHCIQVIQDNCRQMDRLIEGLLTFSRLSRQPLNKQRVDIHDLVNSVLKDFNAERKERCVKIILGHLPSCEADPMLLRQVFFNLLSNAIKFTRQQKEALIEVGSRQEEHPCVYFVKDNGVGFDMQYVHKLFNVFARLHRSEDYEGTGVGLAIVQRIIQRHGGRVWIEAAPDKGTTVYFTI